MKHIFRALFNVLGATGHYAGGFVRGMMTRGYAAGAWIDSRLFMRKGTNP